MKNFPWDKITNIQHPKTGETLVEWAVSTVGTTKVEVSMSDEIIWRVISREQWLQVMLSNRNTAKMDKKGRLNGTLTILFGCGRPNDPLGNLILLRLHFDMLAMAKNMKGPDAEHFKRAMILVGETFKGLGLKPDPDFAKRMGGN